MFGVCLAIGSYNYVWWATDRAFYLFIIFPQHTGAELYVFLSGHAGDVFLGEMLF